MTVNDLTNKLSSFDLDKEFFLDVGNFRYWCSEYDVLEKSGVVFIFSE